MNPGRTDQTGMLLSALFELRAASRHLILGPLGIPIHAWFLNRIRSVDPELSAALHDGDGLKPYTVSSLLDEDGFMLGPGRVLEPGDKCWIRVSLYSGALSKLFYERVIKAVRAQPEQISLFQMDFQVTDCTVNRYMHPLAAKSSFAEIAQSSCYINPKRHFQLNFRSPTAFASNGSTLPLPVPESILRGYVERWNRYCPESMVISDAWVGVVKSRMRIVRISSLQTMEWAIPGEEKYERAVGFKGRVTFGLTGKGRAPEEAGTWRDARAVFQALTDFSFFCGTGKHTTVGMGQTFSNDYQ